MSGDLKELINKGAGIRRTISISNTRKITARRKNRREKGIRAFALGSNPHSKGEDFSRSSEDRKEIVRAMRRIRRGISRVIRRADIVRIILPEYFIIFSLV